MFCMHSTPQCSQRSSFLCLYSYCADRSLPPSTTILLLTNPVLQKAPGRINYLRSGLDGDDALGVRDFVRDWLHIVGLLPAKGGVDLDPFVAMDDAIVDDTIHL